MSPTIRYGKKADRALSMWVKLARAYAVFSKRSTAHIRSFGLTEGQFGALEALGHKGPLTLGELCQKQLVSGGNMTVVIDNLEKEGLVRRVRGNGDRRVITVHLTGKGRELFNRTFGRHAEFIAELASVLTKQEQEQAGSVLKKLGTSLQQPDMKTGASARLSSRRQK
jgi:MarR family 2-MHQ and catechol resistance regulon transcriptional repressor